MATSGMDQAPEGRGAGGPLGFYLTLDVSVALGSCLCLCSWLGWLIKILSKCHQGLSELLHQSTTN